VLTSLTVHHAGVIQKRPEENQLEPDKPNSRTHGGVEIATEALFRRFTGGRVRVTCFFVGGASALASSAALLCGSAVSF